MTPALNLPIVPPVKPMLAKAVKGIPDDGDLAFEPKWDGFRCIVFRDGDEIYLGSRNERPPPAGRSAWAGAPRSPLWRQG